MAVEYVNFSDIAGSVENAQAQIVTEQIVNRSAIMSFFPFLNNKGSIKFPWFPEGELPNIYSRQINQGVDGSVGYDREATEYLKILSSNFDIDDVTARETVNGMSAFQKEAIRHGKSMSFSLPDQLINGNTALNKLETNGLKMWIDDWYHATKNPNKFAYGGSANGLKITDGQVLINEMEKLIQLVPGCNAIFCDEQIFPIIKALFLQGNNSAIAGMFKMNRKYALPNGSTTNIGLWDELPMYAMARRKDQTRIIDFNETLGTSDFTSSIYAVRIGDDGFHGILQSEKTPTTKVVENKNGKTFSQDIVYAYLMRSGDSAARMYGILK